MESPAKDHLRTCNQRYLKIKELSIYNLLRILSFLLVLCPSFLTTDEIASPSGEDNNFYQLEMKELVI